MADAAGAIAGMNDVGKEWARFWLVHAATMCRFGSGPVVLWSAEKARAV